MTSNPNTNAFDPQGEIAAGEIIVLNPAEVTLGERLREIDIPHAQAVGLSMVKDGQITPIDVCRLPGQAGWHLAGAGGHRLTGARLVGMNGIECRPVSASRYSRRLRETIENLFHRGLDPLDRAAHIAELVQLKRERAGLQAADHRAASVPVHLKKAVDAEADVTLETISNVYGWTEELGNDLGFTGRTIRNDLMLYRGLKPSLVSRLRSARHPILKNATQLRGLAKLDPDTQVTVVDALTGADGWEPVATVAEAVKRTQPAKVIPARVAETKRQNTVIDTLTRMTEAERLGLFQSPVFHAVLPEEAKKLLAPMMRGVQSAAPDPTPVVQDKSLSDLIARRDSKLVVALAAAQKLIAEDLDADFIVSDLAKRFGGRARYANGTYELRIAGVTATCTAGAHGLARAWVRAAERKASVA